MRNAQLLRIAILLCFETAAGTASPNCNHQLASVFHACLHLGMICAESHPHTAHLVLHIINVSLLMYKSFRFFVLSNYLWKLDFCITDEQRNWK